MQCPFHRDSPQPCRWKRDAEKSFVRLAVVSEQFHGQFMPLSFFASTSNAALSDDHIQAR
jgi:hypothetical protein